MTDEPIDWHEKFVRACGALGGEMGKLKRLLRVTRIIREKLIHGSDVEHHAVKEFDQILKEWGVK